jgi:hypothetical protein
MVREVGAVEEGQWRNDPRGFLAGDGSMDGRASLAAKQVRRREPGQAGPGWRRAQWAADRGQKGAGARSKRHLVPDPKAELELRSIPNPLCGARPGSCSTTLPLRTASAPRTPPEYRDATCTHNSSPLLLRIRRCPSRLTIPHPSVPVRRRRCSSNSSTLT